MAVAKGITKSGMPFKAGVIAGASVLGGLTHSIFSNMNRARSLYEKDNSTCSNISTNLSKLLDDNVLSSPLKDILYNLELISYTCLSLLIILAIQIIFKLYKDNVNLNITKLVGVNLNNKINYYINKIIYLNKKMNSVYILIIIIILLFAISIIGYTCGDLYNNIDMYVSVHNSFKNK